MTTPERTSQIRNEGREQTTHEQLRQLAQSAHQTLTLLRAQQDLLRQRGMSLPLGMLDRMNEVEMALQNLSTQLFNAQIELKQLRSLAQTTALINSALEVDDLLNRVMDTVITLTAAERGCILLRNEAGELEFRVARHMDSEAVGGTDFEVSSTIIQQVVQTGESVLTDNAGSDPRYQEQKSIMRGAFRSILAVPLRVGDMVTGVVYCDNRILAGLFKEHELNLLRAFADQAAVALENARLFEAVQAQFAEIARIRDLMGGVFASIASGVITLDLNEVIISANAAVEVITGRRANQLVGQNLWSALPNPSEQFVERLRAVQAEQSSERWETSIEVPNIGWREWQITLTPLRASDGTVLGIVLVLDDLTPSRQQEEQVKTVRRYLPLALVENIRSADLTAMGGQEREITVLFADLRGFTGFSEQLEPELLMQIINSYLSVASDAVNLYEGVVDKYIGDAVSALFNTPLNPQSDHAARAVRAAIRLVKEVLVLHERLPESQRLYFGLGIHTGTAVLGNIGSAERREFTAIGEAMDVARLLQENAGKGEVLISEATRALLEDDFDFEAVTLHRTRDGVPTPEQTYRLLGRKRRTSSLPAVQAEA
jgi:PAS domain S-box-containing protein